MDLFKASGGRISFAGSSGKANGRSFTGLACPFDTPTSDDRVPLAFRRGAFAKSVSERGSGHIKLLAHHDPRLAIGKVVEAEEREDGLYISGTLSDTQGGREALTLARDGVVADLSVGVNAIQVQELSEKQLKDPLLRLAAAQSPTGKLRLCTEAQLVEVSLVTWGAIPGAVVESVEAQLAKAQAWLSARRESANASAGYLEQLARGGHL